jgi:hypothetical protein
MALIISTSFAGAFSIMASIDHFAKGGFSEVIIHVIENNTNEVQASWKTYIELAVCAILFCLGMYLEINLLRRCYAYKSDIFRYTSQRRTTTTSLTNEMKPYRFSKRVYI